MKSFSLAVLAVLALAAPVAAQQTSADTTPPGPGAEMFPFVLPWDDSAPSVMDLSSWLDAPAGKYGFVTAKDGHLFVGSKRIRFLGVNTAFDTNFPTHEDADKMAAHMAKYGIGCVRLHHMDTRPAPAGLVKADNATIDPARLERLDYFIAALKKHGIYVNINLHVGRAYPGFEKAKEMSNYFKGVDNYMAAMIESQKKFARDLLQHVNPYTKLAYTDDPCVAFVEINNENALFLEWYNKKADKWPSPYSDELHRQWNAWLTNKYSTDEKLRAAWKGDLLADTAKLGSVEVNKKENGDKRSPEAQRDWLAFLYSVEEKYWGGMYRFLKDDLHVKSVVVGTPQTWSPLPIQLQMDAVDCHGYWQHPSFPHNPWDSEDWTVKNKPMVSDPNGGLIGSLGRLRAAGKPFICTEYMECAPNTYNAEAMGILGAYAALQDWDAVFLFAYAHDIEGMKTGYYKSFFDLATHPAKMATFPAAAAMFLRGDVVTGKPQVVSIPRKQIVEMTRLHGPTFRTTDFGVSQREGLRHPVGMLFTDQGSTAASTPAPATPPTPPAVESDTGQLRWSWPDSGGVITINTPRSAGVIGFAPADQPVALGQVTVTPHTSAQGFATVQATVMDGANFGSARRILVTAAGMTSNTDLRWKTPEHDSVGKNWGQAPSLAEGISATVELPLLPGARAWALDGKGQRAAPVELTARGGRTVLEIGPRWKTLWYEIETGNVR